MDSSKDYKLDKLFKEFLYGKQTLSTGGPGIVPGSQRVPSHILTKGKLFLEAVCNQKDVVECVQKLLTSSHGIPALQKSLLFDQSTSFINNHAASLIRYLQESNLFIAGGGDLLRRILLIIANCAVFFDSFIQAQKDGNLSSEAQQCFAWILLQLISLPASDATNFYKIAQDSAIQKPLSNSANPEIRSLFHKIKNIISVVNSPVQPQENGPGGRHDNDFADFRMISILPTPDEMLSQDQPFLRLAAEIDDVPEPERTSAHIDNHFRLLREDMIRELREELQTPTHGKKGRVRNIEGLRLNGIVCDDKRPWALRLRCTRPLPQLTEAMGKPARLKAIRNNHHFISEGSLACLVADGNIAAFGEILRDDELLSEFPAVICLHLANVEGSNVRMFIQLHTAKQITLRQLNTPVFTYKPILQQLQQIKRLTLSNEILSLSNAGDGSSTSHIYRSMKLVVIAKKLERDPSYDLETDLKLPRSTKLDKSQAQSFIAGIQQKVCLIQGPPGTGKSFIGALIAKALYLYSTKRILVVCYTNHALDQFLEDLIKVGVPSKEIVRLGNSKKASVTTNPLVLREQLTAGPRFKTTRMERQLFGDLQRTVNQLGDGLQKIYDRSSRNKLSHDDLIEYLQFSEDYPHFAEAFKLPEESIEGFNLAGKNGKQISKHYLLNQWANGNDPGIFKDQVDPSYQEIWSLSKEERSRHLAKWKTDILSEDISRFQEEGQQYNSNVASLKTMRNEPDRRLMLDKRFIGCTTTAAAKYVKDIQSTSPDIVIVEEAGEILESHILTALAPETDQLVLIGDHKQLRPKVHYHLSIEKGNGYDLNRSMFERLVLHGDTHNTLSSQRRMRPEISSIIRHLTYPELSDHDDTYNRPQLRGFQNCVMFVTHDHPEGERKDSNELRDYGMTGSKENQFEAEMTLKCVRHLVQQGYRSNQIVVLTPYLGQLRKLMDIFRKEASTDPVLNDMDSYDLVRAGLMPEATAREKRQPLRISTIDNYQGEESDVVVASLVRSNPRGDIGFLASPERLNVLVSRAREGLIIIGNSTTFRSARQGQDLWNKFLDYIADRHYVYDGFPVKCERHPQKMGILKSVEAFESWPDGGCDEPCQHKLSCGQHMCPSRCHQLFDHSKMKCEHSMKTHCPKGHIQEWKCHSGPPNICSKCEYQRKADEKRQRRALEAKAKAEEAQREHERKMAEINAEIEKVQQELNQVEAKKRMDDTYKQRKLDLEAAKQRRDHSQQIQINQASSDPLQPSTSPDRVQPHMEPIEATPGLSHEKNTCITEKSNPQHGEQTKDPPKTLKPNQLDNKWVIPESAAEREWENQKSQECTTNSALDELMQMTGLEKVKDQFLTIKATLETKIRQGVDLKDERLGLVLLGNAGTGKTTVARLYGRFLASINALPGSHFVETTGSKLANDGVSGAKKLIEAAINAGGGVFFIDEAYQLALGHTPGGAAILDFLLAEIENSRGKLAFVLAGYDKQMEKFFEHNQGFDSRLPTKLHFEDYTDAELLSFFKRSVGKKYHGRMKVEGGDSGLFARIFISRIGRCRGKEGFGNVRTVENAIQKLAQRQAQRLKRERLDGKRPDDLFLTREDLIGPEPKQTFETSKAWKDLQKMTGLDSVKLAVKGFIGRIHQNYLRELEELPGLEVSLNRLFLGSPGTGKTTVAKLYGKILAEIGLLSSSEVVTKVPADFIGAALGGSEQATKAILKASEGKVLIIDEAYMFNSSGPDGANHTDPYRTAVIDTIVSEVQSTPGEDRAVLMLGYRAQMETMLQKSNPGLARRFPIENAFNFDDYNDSQLLEILELKMTKQGLTADAQAKQVAIDVLAKERRKPNFGNAGAVENLLSRAKDSNQRRNTGSAHVHLEAQDFDADFGRSNDALSRCDELFKDMVGFEDTVDKIKGWIQAAAKIRQRNGDPADLIPFNLIFKGPPGTGKTTIARKFGEVFCDMGFLASSNVIDCSVTDLVGQYVGQTGPKVQGILRKALGQVLFIDEAYRLSEGHFAKEAIDELVDCLTKEEFKGKMIVILAGYEDDMNELLRVNSGLSSRFPEEVLFRNLDPDSCFNLFTKKLDKKDISIHSPGHEEEKQKQKVTELFGELSAMPGWGNGRDVETIAKKVMEHVFKTAGSNSQDLQVSHYKVVEIMKQFRTERLARTSTSASSSRTPKPNPFPNQPLFDFQQAPPPPRMATNMTTTTKKAEAEQNKREESEEDHEQEQEKTTEPTVQETSLRDPGVSDATWHQLQKDREANDLEVAQAAAAIKQAQQDLETQQRQATSLEQIYQKKQRSAPPPSPNNGADNEAARRHELARLQAVKAQRLADEAASKLRAIQKEQERRRREEAKVQRKLREIGVCVMGFRWIKQDGGYRCAGGSHFVTDGELGI